FNSCKYLKLPHCQASQAPRHTRISTASSRPTPPRTKTRPDPAERKNAMQKSQNDKPEIGGASISFFVPNADKTARERLNKLAAINKFCLSHREIIPREDSEAGNPASTKSTAKSVKRRVASNKRLRSTPP